MPDTTYWELLPDYGTEPPYLTGPDGLPVENPKAGDPQPLTHAPSWDIYVPTKAGDAFVMKSKTVKTKLVDGHPRVFSTDNPLLVDPIVQSGLFRQVDPPKSTASSKES